MRTLDRTMKANKTSHWHLPAALKYRKTEPGCDDSLNLALNSAAQNSEIYSARVGSYKTSMGKL